MASDGPAAHAPAPSRPAALDLRPCFPCAGSDLAAARACEQVVFGRQYGNTPAQLLAEYGPYEGGSAFGAVLLPDGTAVGAVRLLRGGPAGLKTLQDAAGSPWSLPPAATCDRAGLDPVAAWDIATFGVDRERCGPGSRPVTLALLSVLFGTFRDNGVPSYVALLDAGARRAFAALGIVMTDLPGAVPAPYLGSPQSVPVYAHVPQVHRQHARASPGLHEQVFHGRGIPGLDPPGAGPGRFALTRTALPQPVPSGGCDAPVGGLPA